MSKTSVGIITYHFRKQNEPIKSDQVLNTNVIYYTQIRLDYRNLEWSQTS